MELLEVISDEVMVLAFLKAEVDSGIYGPGVEHFLTQRGRDRSLIDDADLGDDEQNRIRREVLRHLRGYGANKMLFEKLPANIVWRRARLTVRELAAIKYTGWPDWVRLTHGTRLVSEGARNASNPFFASDEIREHVPAIVDAVRASTLPELILVGKPDSDELVLLEGHKRATAYQLGLDPDDELDVIIGTSESIEEWKGWRPILVLSGLAIRPTS